MSLKGYLSLLDVGIEKHRFVAPSVREVAFFRNKVDCSSFPKIGIDLWRKIEEFDKDKG